MPAARAIVVIENLNDVRVTSSRNADQGAVLTFAAVTGTTPIAAASLLSLRSPDPGSLPGAATLGY